MIQTKLAGLDVMKLTTNDYVVNETLLYQNMTAGFDECVQSTLEWLQTPDAIEYFMNQENMISTFFKESGIRDEWDNIIERRATRGADLTKQIFDYARRVNMEDYLVPYTPSERRALNLLCDNNYELIRNVTSDQVRGIRRQLIQDYSEGVHPSNTSIKEALEQIQLEPINGLSPESRAEMIARTESARALNISTLETLRADGITMVSLYGCDETCEECQQYAHPIPIEEALEVGVVHPNCTGVWVSEKVE